MGTSVIRSDFLEKVVHLSLHSRDSPKSLRNHKRLCKPIMNPATSILFLGLVLSTAQGLQVKSFEAEPATPPKGSQVKLTATPDSDWKTCIINLGSNKICDITKEGMKGLTNDKKYKCIAKSATEGSTEEKIGSCGVIVHEAQAEKWTVKMTGDDGEAQKDLELTVGPANGAGIPQLGMAIWIQLASTFAL